jgi:hypothetical protein
MWGQPLVCHAFRCIRAGLAVKSERCVGTWQRADIATKVSPKTYPCVFGLHVLSWWLLHFAVAASRLRFAFEPRQLNPNF